jgi:hypothetical protein
MLKRESSSLPEELDIVVTRNRHRGERPVTGQAGREAVGELQVVEQILASLRFRHNHVEERGLIWACRIARHLIDSCDPRELEISIGTHRDLTLTYTLSRTTCKRIDATKPAITLADSAGCGKIPCSSSR